MSLRSLVVILLLFSSSAVSAWPAGPSSWRVTRAECIGLCSSYPRNGREFVGVRATYSSGAARFGRYRCDAAKYQAKSVPSEEFTDGFNGSGAYQYNALVTPEKLGLPPGKIEVIEVACKGKSWAAPGATIVPLQNGQLLTVWDGYWLWLSRTDHGSKHNKPLKRTGAVSRALRRGSRAGRSAA